MNFIKHLVDTAIAKSTNPNAKCVELKSKYPFLESYITKKQQDIVTWELNRFHALYG